ncbi:hypothetical protein RFI_38025, partial [Reticulomyxa filosa]
IIVKNSCLLNDKDNCATCGNRVYTITARYVCNCDCYDCKTYRESHKLINVKSNKSRLTYRFRHPVELYPELSNSLSYVQCLFEKFANKYCDSDYFFFDKEYNEQKHVQIIDSEDEGNSNDNVILNIALSPDTNKSSNNEKLNEEKADTNDT